MRSFLITLAIIYGFISCRKNDFSARLISIKNEITSSPKVYTSLGEITDKTVVENYIKGWNGQYFVFNTDTAINYPVDTIFFKTNDILIIPQLPGLWGKRVVKPNGKYLFFYLTDTLQGNKRMDNVLNGIVSNIGIVKPFYKDACPWYIGTNGSSCFTEWVYDAYVATGTTSRLEFPLLTYKLTRSTNGSSTGLTQQNYNNVFDPAMLKLLQQGDTLAIQTARRIYVRTN